MTAETAQEIILGNAESSIFAQLVAQMLGGSIEKMRGSLGEIFWIDPSRPDKRPVEMVFDHPLECPGLGALLQIQRSMEIEAVFVLDMRANEGRVGDALGVIINVGQLPFGRGRRHGL